MAMQLNQTLTQLTRPGCQNVRAICYDLRLPDFLRGVRLALSLRPEAEMMTVEQNPTLRRKSMELIKELTQIVQEITFRR
jgi:hypothetical protein